MISGNTNNPVLDQQGIKRSLSQTPFFSPSSIVAIFNAAMATNEEKKIIQVRGIFKKVGTVNYNGTYYNRLKDEASDNTMTLITSALMHNQLEDNKTIEFYGYITRKIDKQGKIEIIINLDELLDQRVNKFSEEEIKKIGLINRKVTNGAKDLDAHIKNCIFNNKKIVVKIIMGKSGIIDSDINKGMESAIALFDIEYHKISLSSPKEIIDKIAFLDTLNADVICVARGGGENLEIFENLEISNSILDRQTIIASAIGHAKDVSLFEKLADKKFITPTHFGHYLKEIYDSTIEEFETSKARLVNDITKQLDANYGKQIQNLTDQLKASKDLHERTANEAQKNHLEQIGTLTAKLKSLEDLRDKSIEERAAIHKSEVGHLKKQIEELTHSYQNQLAQKNELQAEKIKSLNDQIQTLHNQERQKESLIKQSSDLATMYQNRLKEAESKPQISIVALVIAIVVGIFIGFIISKR